MKFLVNILNHRGKLCLIVSQYLHASSVSNTKHSAQYADTCTITIPLMLCFNHYISLKNHCSIHNLQAQLSLIFIVMMVKVSAFPSFNQPMQPSLTQENIKIAAKESIRVTSLTGYNTQPPVNHRSSLGKLAPALSLR